MDEQLKLLKKLCLAYGPTGCESMVKDLIAEETAGTYDSAETDRLGNLILFKKGRSDAHRLMICAHMDEVGFMVTDIDDSGFLSFESIGIDPRVLCGKQVLVGDGKKQYPGVISSKPIHLLDADERKSATPVDRMYIDIGCKSKEEAQKLVKRGSWGAFASDFTRFGKDGRMLSSKAIDDRLGCAVMCNILKSMSEKGEKPPFDTYFAFTVREEVGLSGARVAAFKVDPDYALVLESTAIGDISGSADALKVAFCGEGGVISLLDRATIYDRDYVNYAVSTAKKHDIKYQIKKYVSGGNDSGVIHRSREGVKTLTLSAPTRYLHTACNVINISDYGYINELTYCLISDMEEFIK